MSDPKRTDDATSDSRSEAVLPTRTRKWRSTFSAVGALATGIAAVQCAAELEDPARFKSSVVATGGSTSTGGTSGKAPPSSTPACVLAIMTASCATTACHSATGTPVTTGGLVLSGANPAQQTVDVLATNAGVAQFDKVNGLAKCVPGAKVIDTTTPANSTMLQRLNGTQPCGVAMPATGVLTDDQKTCLTNWIMNPYAAANVITTGAGGTSAGGEGTAGKGDGGL